MKINAFKRLPEQTQGIIFLLFGIAMLLLYFFGVLQKSIVIAVLALAIISLIMGCKKLGWFAMLEKQLRKRK